MLEKKKMFKVLAPIEKPGKETHWMRLGTAYTNKDDSINVYVDLLPVNQKDLKLQLRELDEEDFRKKDAARPVAPYTSNPMPARAPDALPF